MMIEKIQKFIKENDLNIYDIAVISGDGEEGAYCQPCPACHENYSITKFFIVTAIGLLFDKGKIKLDDRLTDILGDELKFSYDRIWDKVTVRHALQHKMGLEEGVIDIDRDDINDYGTKDFLEYIFRYPPEKEPGTYYKYTDVPHYLLSRAISCLTGNAADILINEEIAAPLHFRQISFARCPLNHTIGGSGSYMRAQDVVKLGWLYLNDGKYGDKQILSKKWVELTEQEEYMDPGHLFGTSFIGKGGMRGQMVMYSRKKKMAAAWHGYDEKERDREMIPFMEEL